MDSIETLICAIQIEDKVILAMVRGDHDVNEVAVQHAVNGGVTKFSQFGGR